MAAEAMLADGAGVSVSHGLALLDIVKHALRTVIQLLNGKDRLAIVAYSNTASVILELTPMTPEGQQRAELRLHQLIPDGMTNLWAGLETGIQLLAAASDGLRLQHLLLLTDGIPNINPPRGIVPMLKRLKDKCGGRLPCSVNTFGFGYELDSELLHELARLSSASYAFIPDAGFVGTVFVNAVTNLLVTMGANPVLTLTADQGASLPLCAVPGGLVVKQVAGGLQVELSSLQFGQTRHVLVRGAPITGALSANLDYCTRNRNRRNASLTCRLCQLPAAEGSIDQKARVLLVDGVRMAMSALKQTNLDKLKDMPLPLPTAQEQIKQLETSIRALGGISEAVEALLEDLSGQVAEAFSREEWYTRWGIHFLPSLLCAHACQQCNNFKDPGVQHYGGELFGDLRDKADEVFCNLEAPKPQPRPSLPKALPAPAAPSRPVQAARVVDMSVYYDASAG
ncbi:ITIH5 [Symbiodinium pilosum]|uniref:ITIH5 protein n=1 Tax=Symbiodinium pilosum TaxID=2952 RepID=A0A812WED1_SYMPI|nr:ITIH5 [Symbiodinium pilosum]